MSTTGTFLFANKITHVDNGDGSNYDTMLETNLNDGLLSIPGADLKTVAQTSLMTVPDGKILIVFDVLAIIRTIDTCTVAPTIGVGTAAGSYVDCVASVTPAFFVGGVVDQYKSLNVGDIRRVFYPGDELKLDVSGGATATTLTGRILIIGMLIDA